MKNPILGLDVDQENLAACLLVGDNKHARKFKNNPSGFKDLLTWLARFNVSTGLVCMESTARFGNKVGEFLHHHGFRIAVVNPSFIVSHKEALNRHNKTDPRDAEAIADYARCFEQKLRLWQPKSPIHQSLIDVVGQIELIKKTITAFSNRAGCGIESTEVLSSLNETIEQLHAQLVTMEATKNRLFEQLPPLNTVREIVRSTPGIGNVGASALAARFNFDDFENGRDLAAFLGLGSREWQSGKTKRKGRATKAGDKELRSILRMGAMAAMYQKHSYYAEFVER